MASVTTDSLVLKNCFNWLSLKGSNLAIQEYALPEKDANADCWAEVHPTTLSIDWTAPYAYEDGINPSSGTATSYEVRYAPVQILS